MHKTPFKSGGVNTERSHISFWLVCETYGFTHLGDQRRTNEFDDKPTEVLALFGGEVGEDITALFRQEFEGHGKVVVLQHRGIIIQQRQFVTCKETIHFFKQNDNAQTGVIFV